MGLVTNFFGCRILRGGKLVNEDLWVRGGKIIDPIQVNYHADISIDCGNNIIAPGLIDLKINGSLGINLNDPDAVTPENILRIRKFLPNTGVTMFCPTLISTTPENYAKIIPIIEPTIADPQNGAGIVGVHLDGPFLSVQGAHQQQVLRDFSQGGQKAIKNIYGDRLENVAIVTLAPDLPNSQEAIKTFKRWGIKVSIGHSKATINEAENAVLHGATLISHLFNAMPSFHHRDPGIVGLIASDVAEKNHMKFTIIADQYHMHNAALRMAYRMAPDMLIIITDATAPMGLGPGYYNLPNIGEIQVVEENGKSFCRNVQKQVLFGSVCPLHRAIRNFIDTTKCSVEFALEAASKKPAEALGIYPTKGSLEFGADADFVILQPKTLNLCGTFIAGKKVADNDLLPSLRRLELEMKSVPDFYAPNTPNRKGDFTPNRKGDFTPKPAF